MTQTQTQQRFSSFAVVGEEGVYLSDGGRMARPAFQQLEYWLDAMTRRQIDTLWLHPSAGWRWRDADMDGCGRWLIRGGAGEQIGEPWWTATCPGVYGVRDLVQPSYEDRAPWRDTPSAAALRDSLLAFRASVGLDWRRSPGATGLRLLRSLHSGAHATRLELPGDPPPPAVGGVVRGAGHLNWTRPLRADERGLYLHSYDVNGQYLAACSSLPLGVGAYEHHIRTTLPDKPAQWLPGYYCVRASEEAKNGPCPPILMDGTAQWVTTPTLRLLREQGASLRITESYIWHSSARYLEPWYKAIRNARATLTDPYALDALKGLYRLGIAWFESAKWDRHEDMLYRPDWAQQVRALAAANVLRTVDRVGINCDLWPLAVGSDCVYYLSASPDPLAVGVSVIDGRGIQPTDGVRVSSQLGHYKVKDRAIPVAEIAHYLRGHWSLIPLQEALNIRAGRHNRGAA